MPKQLLGEKSFFHRRLIRTPAARQASVEKLRSASVPDEPRMTFFFGPLLSTRYRVRRSTRGRLQGKWGHTADTSLEANP